MITDKKKIGEIFDRGIIVEILPGGDALKKKMLAGERLKIYIGADPTSTSLHLSHAKNYMLLEEFRKLGHEVFILVGDFTAMIGDPSGRAEARIPLTETQVKENVKGWVSQIKPLLDFSDKKNPPHIVYNNDWLSKLSPQEMLFLASQFTVQHMMERDMFEKRWDAELPIHLNEFYYPVLQGYDSVALDVDVELCGTDQIFNALAGRTLLKKLKNKEKFVVAVNLMENPKTHELMSKSRGNGIFLSFPPDEMYGAIMSQPDEMIEIFFINCTHIPLSEVKKIIKRGPRIAKAAVALEIVKNIYGEASAKKAQEHFEKVFSRHEIPDDIPALKLKTKKISALDLVFATGVMRSKSDARRLIEQGGFELDEKVIKNPLEEIILKGGEVARVGKKNFFKTS